MNNIEKVRKSIAKRNKYRSIQTKGVSSNKITPSFPEEEEKHGYYPLFQGDGSKSETKSEFFGQFLLKGVLSVILFFVVAILLQSNNSFLEKPKKWTNEALVEDFPFARVHQWYKEAFGAPLAFTPQNINLIDDMKEDILPVSGNVTQSFQANGSGILIQPDGSSSVSSWDDGVVIFAGSKKSTNKTIIVQHADRSKTTYGNLSSLDVHLYQFVSKNQKIGMFNPSEDSTTVFFSIEKNFEYIDPIKVIKVDDIP